MCSGRAVRHEPVRIAGLAALAVRAPAASRPPGRRTACGATCLAGSRLRVLAARDVHRLLRLGRAERVLLLGVDQLGEDALRGAAGHGRRLVRAERVEEVDEVVADRLVRAPRTGAPASSPARRCGGPSARAACSGCRPGPRRPGTGPRGPRPSCRRLAEGRHAGLERVVHERQRASAAARCPAGGRARPRRSGPGTASGRGTTRSRPAASAGSPRSSPAAPRDRARSPRRWWPSRRTSAPAPAPPAPPAPPRRRGPGRSRAAPSSGSDRLRITGSR